MKVQPIEKDLSGWEMATGIRVVNPHGWREEKVPIGQPITLSRFRELCETSTIRLSDSATWG